MSSPNQSAVKPILGPNTTSDDDDTSRNPISVVAAPSPKKLPGAVRYMECLKNHAAAIGGSATDGCGEFMAGGDEGTLEALKCSACNCHRNFHRKIHILHQDPSSVNYMMNKNKMMGGNISGGPSEGGGQATKKRFRTKFSQEQKDKMLEFAERAGWKIQKLEDSEVRRFCQEIGIKRKVLKVWMHNNKYNFANKTSNSTN